MHSFTLQFRKHYYFESSDTTALSRAFPACPQKSFPHARGCPRGAGSAGRAGRGLGRVELKGARKRGHAGRMESEGMMCGHDVMMDGHEAGLR